MRPHIIDHYLLRECVKTWLAVAATLLVLLLGMGFSRFIAQAAAGELPPETVLTIAGFNALEDMPIVLPASLLLAIMLTVGRLCRDNEMAALTAGGVGLAQLYRPFLLFAMLVAAVAAWLSFSIAPQSSRAMDRLRQQGDVLAQLQSFEAGRFHTIMDGRAAFYAETVDSETGAMRNVFIRVADKESRETVLLAKRAVRRSDPATGRQTLVLRDGWRYEGVPGRGGYRIAHFAEHGVHVRPPTPTPDYDLKQADTATLLGDAGSRARAELQRRLAVPVSVLLLALLALPLGYLPPRSGRYGKLVLGILIYVAYINSLHLAQVWTAKGPVPPAFGLWSVHAVMLLLAAGLIARRQGYFTRVPTASRA